MPRKQKFKPSITRVKLNPEQAVLSCICYQTGLKYVYSDIITNKGVMNYNYPGPICGNNRMVPMWDHLLDQLYGHGSSAPGATVS